MSAQKYRRKVTQTTAEQLTDFENPPQGVTVFDSDPDEGKKGYVITIHGQRTPVVLGDWILPEPDGIHFYPVKPSVFEATYCPVTGESAAERIQAWQNTADAPGAVEQDEASRGFWNGIEASLAILEDREPNFRTKEQNTGTQSFREALGFLINYHSMEGRGRGGDTPDFILADLLDGVLALFDKTMEAREGWYGRDPQMRKDAVSLGQLAVPLEIKAEEPAAPATASYDSRPDTQAHIDRVRDLLLVVRQNFKDRADAHDLSKLEEPEKSEFDRTTPLLKALVYGTPEYAAALADLKPALEHHYQENDHHPEHYAMEFPAGEARVRALENGVAIPRMSLFALLEMLVDWKAAGERHAGGGDIWKSLEINTKRFGFSPQVAGIFAVTIHELGW